MVTITRSIKAKVTKATTNTNTKATNSNNTNSTNTNTKATTTKTKVVKAKAKAKVTKAKAAKAKIIKAARAKALKKKREMTPAKLFGEKSPPSVVSYARCSVKPKTVVDNDCFSYQQQHHSNRVWVTQNKPGLTEVVPEYSEFGSAYQVNEIPPTLLGLLRHLRNATIVIAFADRLCRNIDNLRKLIAPLMRKNKIHIVVSGNGNVFDLTTANYETCLLKMTTYFAMYHEESAIKSERSKTLHQFRKLQQATTTSATISP